MNDECTYFLNGLLYSEGDSVPFSGLVIRYYLDNKKESCVSYYKGKPKGKYQNWHPNGVLHYVGYYDSGGVETGTYKEFSESGTLLIEGSFYNGEKKGWWKFYDVQGVLLQVEKYPADMSKKTKFHQSKFQP